MKDQQSLERIAEPEDRVAALEQHVAEGQREPLLQTGVLSLFRLRKPTVPYSKGANLAQKVKNAVYR